jgi:hypothetical protein
MPIANLCLVVQVVFAGCTQVKIGEYISMVGVHAIVADPDMDTNNRSV